MKNVILNIVYFPIRIYPMLFLRNANLIIVILVWPKLQTYPLKIQNLKTANY